MSFLNKVCLFGVTIILFSMLTVFSREHNPTYNNLEVSVSEKPSLPIHNYQHTSTSCLKSQSKNKLDFFTIYLSAVIVPSGLSSRTSNHRLDENVVLALDESEVYFRNKCCSARRKDSPPFSHSSLVLGSVNSENHKMANCIEHVLNDPNEISQSGKLTVLRI